MAKKKELHPSLYTIFNPNVLIRAKKDGLSITEINVYHEILNHNHKDNPGQLIYKVPFETVLHHDLDKNLARDRRRIAENLMNRKFYLAQEFMMEFLGIKKERYLIPFPTVDFDLENKKSFEVHLNTNFKKVLTLLDTGFTKGAIEDLREFKSKASKVFYWVARQKQTFKQVWKTTFEELKEEMDMSDQYPRWGNFLSRVLDPIHSEFKGTWMEFDLKLERKRNKVKYIIFIFKHGPKDIADKPAGMVFEWEKDLLGWGVNAERVKEIRQRVKVNQQSEEYGFVWGKEYVVYSLEGARNEYNKKLQNARKQKAEKGKSTISMVKNTGGWIVNGLMTGQWFWYVREKINEQIRIKQSRLDFGDLYEQVLDGTDNGKTSYIDTEYEELPGPSIKPAMKQVTFKDNEAREFYGLSNPEIPFENFMKNLGYVQTPGGEWVK